MATKDTMESSNCSLYNNNTLSDITTKFNGRQVSAHKAILAQKSAYSMTTFTGQFPVATSEEVDLGDDDDPEAIHAMLRYIYDMPYAHQITGSSTLEEDLIFCLNVFIVADKYDVAGLRRKVVPDFRLHLLARKPEYFFRAFSSQFSVASCNEVDLGDDEDAEAIRAMIRHIYGLRYDKMLEENTVDDSAAFSTNEDLLFHISVFTAADKYDVASLRPLVVNKFEGLMETSWESESFATSMQKLTGPSAGHLADNTLQAAAAAFCARNLLKLIKKDSFVKMIQEEEPFTGRLLTNYLGGGNWDYYSD
ncbi:hypothetical protein KCU77_g6244, partial [Aureobasidium melanogenum]